MSISKFILGVILRFVIFTWLYIAFGFYSNYIVSKIRWSYGSEFLFYRLGYSVLAIFMTYLKYDQRILARFIAIKGVLPVLAAALIWCGLSSLSLGIKV